MKNLLLLSFPFLCASAALASAGQSCPDQRASQVDARIVHFGDPQRCGVGVVILGLPISIGGARCYPHEVLYPAHQECLGAPSPGTQCVGEDTLTVELRACECQFLSVIGTGLAVPKCSCRAAGNLGTIEDARTVPCHIVQ